MTLHPILALIMLVALCIIMASMEGPPDPPA